jgi:hypothetical protein
MRGSWPNRVLSYLPYVSLIGLAALVANVMLSFEEPHVMVLVGSAVLLCVAPVGMLVHFSSTSELSSEERRLWIAGLASRSGPALFVAYFLPGERARATQRLTRAAREGR